MESSMMSELFHSWDGIEAGTDSSVDTADGADRPEYQAIGTNLPTFKFAGKAEILKAPTESAVAIGCRLVSRDWGQKFANFLNGEMALIHLDADSKLAAPEVPIVARMLNMIFGCNLLRWSSSALLVAFGNDRLYKAFGQSVVSNRDILGKGLRICTIEGAVYADFPPCFVLVQQSKAVAAHVRADLNNAVRAFQSQFRFVSITDNLPEAELPQSGQTPSVGFVLLFSGKQQTSAQYCMQTLSSQDGPWQVVDTPAEARAHLGAYAPQIFRHSSVQLPSVGVATGYPYDGVRVVVYVRDEQASGKGTGRFEAMVTFYSRLLGQTPSTHVKLSSDVEYQIFSQISRLSEFVVARYAGLRVQPFTGVNICFLLRNFNGAAQENFEELSSGYYRLVDPDGNSVLCACPLE